MTHVTWKKTLAAAALTTALVGGSATAANAITYYPPGTNISVSATQSGPRTYVVTVKGGVFAAGRTVVIKIPRAFGSRFGAVSPAEADATWTVVSNAEGGVDPFNVTVPEELQGTFTLTAATDEESVSSTFSVSPEKVLTVVTQSTSSGVSGAAIGMWVLGGAAGVAGIALAGSALARRREAGLAV